MIKDRSFLFFLLLSGMFFALMLIPLISLSAEPRFSGELNPQLIFNENNNHESD